ncbi:MAG: N-6 DNA methylase [Candidatus Atribacteria bacterium]|nr:N-6 DNA methylase [Candidatus Atribacteria bacterium]
MREQQLLYSEENLLPQNLPYLKELRPTRNLSAIFDECHNYIYANEGLLKDKIFHEIVKLLIMKLYDEQNTTNGNLQFGITSVEYRSILANKASSFEVRISKLFNTVQNEYNSFFSDNSLRLKSQTLAYIVGRLQYVNLTQTPGDIKGEAFQKFVYRHQRGDRGEFFTPHPVVRLAVEMIAPKPNERVIDPACGSGGFLIQIIAYICRNNLYIDKRDYIQKYICGIEFNPDVALSAMLRLAFEGGTGREIICANALVENEQFTSAFDVVHTNPPFGSKGKVEDQKILKFYQLARKWNKSQNGDWDVTRNVLLGQSPEILFIEKCLKLLRPGGRMAIVLPDGLLQNISNSHVRFWIRSQAKILGVVSIPQEAFIPYGTGIKTSLLLLQKLPADTKKVFMAQIQKIGYDVKGQPIYMKTNDGKMVKGKSGLPIVDTDIDEIISEYYEFKNGKYEINKENIYTVSEKSLNTRLDAEHYKPKDRNLIEMLRINGAKPVSELADILKETDNFRYASNGEIKYIAISDIDARAMQVVSYQIIKPHEAPSRATYRVRTGDIITAISGASTGTERHATALITEDEDGAICSNGFAVLRNIHSIEPLLLLSYMRTGHFLRQVRRLMTGHAIPSISIEDLSKVLVLIPPKEVQKQISDKIAKVLSMRKEVFKVGVKVIEEVESLVSKIIKA